MTKSPIELFWTAKKGVNYLEFFKPSFKFTRQTGKFTFLFFGCGDGGGGEGGGAEP